MNKEMRELVSGAHAPTDNTPNSTGAQDRKERAEGCRTAEQVIRGTSEVI